MGSSFFEVRKGLHHIAPEGFNFIEEMGKAAEAHAPVAEVSGYEMLVNVSLT